MKKVTEAAKVLDHGYVRLVDHMGTDLTPLEAARMSTDNPTGVDDTKDNNTRNYLWREEHSSPFEMNVACFELQVPIFVLRQLDRHRTVDVDNTVIEGYDEFRKFTSRNEFSGRYSVMPDLYYIPSPERIRSTGKNKQGSSEELPVDVQNRAVELMQELTKNSRDGYDLLVSNGVATELSRLVLPANQYVKIRLQACLLNWLKFLKKRLPENAQWETRQYAEPIAKRIQTLWPKCYAVFEEHTLYASTLSFTDKQLLSRVLERLSGGQLLRNHFIQEARTLRLYGYDDPAVHVDRLTKKLGIDTLYE